MARQAFVPGWGYLNQTTTQQMLWPGMVYVNEAAASGSGGVVAYYRTLMGMGM